MGRILTVLTGVALCFVLTGCPMVGSKEIMGDKTAKASAVKWNGNWVSSDSIIQVRVKDKDKGVLEIYFIQRKKKQGPYKVYLRDVDGHIVASLKDREGGYYLWSVVDTHDDFGYLMLLNMKKFKELIEAGELPGKIVKTVPVLDKLSDKQRSDIISKAANDFEYRQGVTFVRLEGLDRIRKNAEKIIKEAKAVPAK